MQNFTLPNYMLYLSFVVTLKPPCTTTGTGEMHLLPRSRDRSSTCHRYNVGIAKVRLA